MSSHRSFTRDLKSSTKHQSNVLSSLPALVNLQCAPLGCWETDAAFVKHKKNPGRLTFYDINLG